MSQISILAFLFIRKCKVITWEQFSMSLNHTCLKKIQRYLAVINSSKMVVLTKADKDEYPYFLQHKVMAIPNFTTINISNKQSSLDSNVVLAVGRLEDVKGFDLLIKSWKKISKTNPDYRLRIVGGGKLNKMLQDLINNMELNKFIEIVPPTKTIEDEYLKSSLFVLSSRFEPFGLVLIEAKSYGLPIISFDCPFGPREIVNDGYDGILVPNGDINKMADSIIYIMRNKDRLREMGQNGFLDYKKRWSEKKAFPANVNFRITA